ncbi:GreA/GreB family elongation factor [Phenylobacterium sp. LjRoot164]|uniref:GreA/GreB family elongation factor n=1 Tax=unclassified Phenylobacterium TaxID=2640670 RepID=UPI003ECF28F8
MTTTELPPIYATSEDYERLTALGDKLRPTDGPGVHLLLAELARLQVAAPDAEPFARLGVRVRYLNAQSQRIKTARLVMPKDEKLHESSVTVTSPMGAALLGLKAGCEFDWRDTGGSRRRVTVLEVLD